MFAADNHEHYRTGVSPAEDILQLRADTEKDRKDHRRETWLLENDAIELSLGSERIRFIGATFWTDFQLFGNPVKHAALGAEPGERLRPHTIQP